MKNNDDIFEQFKVAAERDRSEFEALEQVWSRVEGRLDSGALHKQKRFWKKLAVAASLLAIISLGYHYTQQEDVPAANQQIATDHEEHLIQDEAAVEAIVGTSEKSSETTIKPTDPNATTAFVPGGDTIAYHSDARVAVALKNTGAVQENDTTGSVGESMTIAESETRGGKWLVSKVFEARSVSNHMAERSRATLVPQNIPATPLVVIDGKAIKNSAQLQEQGNKTITSEDIETVVFLKEPLYIINGVEYSEESLFSSKPSSPYAPLTEQEIISIEILQDQRATDRYGSKGDKGVVIIKTLNGKPKRN